MRAFVRFREAMASTNEFAWRLDELEKRIASQDENIPTHFQAMRQWMTVPEKLPQKSASSSGQSAPPMGGDKDWQEREWRSVSFPLRSPLHS
jgi:hypothetical protein